MQQHHGFKLCTGRGVAQKYYIKYESGWAYVLLDESGPLVSVVSDWGSWNHLLDPTGDRNLLDFMVGTSPSYFRDKFQAQTGDYWFDFESTLTRLKQDVKEMASVEDRDELLLELFEFEPVSSIKSYLHELRSSCPKVYSLYPEIADIPCVTGYWPDFVEMWREDSKL